MASSSSSSGSSSNSGHSSSSGSSSGQAPSCSGKKDSSSKQKLVSVRIQPTIGPSFALSLHTSTKIPALKESISDKMGLSPQKMTLLLHNNALNTGTLTENGIIDGTEVRLVPAIESGVTTTNSVDPVAMMKHSMSGISDQQIDDFLNGKFPLSVAIRVGESVVVVNLHRAKVEEIEMEPPPHKKRCTRSHRPTHHDDVDYLESSSSTLSAKHSSSHYRYLNSNHSASDLMGGRNFSPPSAHHHHHHHRSSRRKVHRSLGKSQDLLESQHQTHNPSAAASFPLVQPDRSMLSYTRDTPMETSVALSAPPPMEAPTHTPIPRATPIISKDAPVLAPPSPPHHEVAAVEETKVDFSDKPVSLMACSGEESMEISTEPPNLTGNTPTAESTHCEMTTCAQDVNGDSPPISGTPAQEVASTDPSGSSKNTSVSRSVQTDPEPLPREKKENASRTVPRRDGKALNRREVKLPESGISMKRKAVMEAISEILKKMYANTEKGRLPGSFKGRFSSEFTCDSDMREILHSKTTMTSYGSEGEGSSKADAGDANGSDKHRQHISKARLEEHQQIKDKVADLKWRMQHKRALKMAKRKGERSPCGWMEALNCDMPRGEPKPMLRSGYCGLKRGFLLTD